ncbi:uncharacterized protein LOC110906724 [Helianthus annuus]|uniref:uncharacterized protein LOC110906724 n=1 Tax=Helianthus annuus TaxID=4232 RepID=UPI000B8F16E6|nr:uncharacterized protein LOC110906724 [Helianthus annuus]
MERRGRGGQETRRWNIKEKPPEVRDKTKEDEEWEKVRKKKGAGEIDEEPSTTILLANLPEGVSRKEIWLECRRYGNITDVFLPFKRDLKGKRFAFVRFNKYRDLVKLVQALNNIWIGDRKVKANVSKSEREEEKETRGVKSRKEGTWTKWPVNKTVLKPENELTRRQEEGSIQDGAQGRVGGRKSYLDALRGNREKTWGKCWFCRITTKKIQKNGARE